MLVAPFPTSACPLAPVARRSLPNAADRVSPLPQPDGSCMGWLGLWALCGALGWSALALLHGYPGHSMSFWLLGAPLIDLAWLLLRRWRPTRRRNRGWQ